MSEYKLVPFEPTPEMVFAAEDAYMPFGDMDLALRMAVLAAPDVQGEPVSYQCRPAGSPHWSECSKGEHDHLKSGKPSMDGVKREARALYTAPQPAEQQPECGCCGQTDRCDDDCDAVVIGGHRAAEQKPTTDVSGLAEALEEIRGLPSVRQDEAAFIAGSALATYRKGGE